MKTWLRKFALLLALTGMPLQGVAATLSTPLCHGDARTHAMSVDSDQHDSQQGGRGTSTHAVDHLCTPVTLSAPSVVALPAALVDFPVQTFDPDPLHDLFVPDRPQRPPLV